MAQIKNTNMGTMNVGELTLIISAESAKKVLVIGLHFANAFVYADRSTSA
jgi:hypothetical protein